jgi:hypothetical protein
MASISPTFLNDISCTLAKIENVYIGADCSLEEILIYTKIFKELRDVFLGHMKRCQESTLEFLNMRLKLTRMLSLFENVLELSIPRRPLLLR